MVEDDGTEHFICSLCARPEDSAGVPLEPAEELAAVAGGRVKPARADTDVFWRALKDKDAEIERLESLLARSEAEKQELAAQLAQSRGESTFERSPEVGADTAEMAAPDFEADATAPRQTTAACRRPRQRRRPLHDDGAARATRPRAHRPPPGRGPAPRRGARQSRPAAADLPDVAVHSDTAATLR